MEKILEYLREKDITFYRLVYFTLETGARRIEVLRARWEDIDWERQVIVLLREAIEEGLKCPAPKMHPVGLKIVK